MELREFKKNLFSVPASFALVHCISEDAKMGKGIAELFVKRFPHMRKHILQQDPRVGDCILYVDEDGQHVFNLITKKHYYGKPTYRTLEVSLSSMHHLMQEHDITKLAMPTIGCGLDRLEWHVVKQILAQEFKHTTGKIAVCHKPD